MVDSLDKKFNLDLRNSRPEDIDVEILPSVGKLYFKNVKRAMDK
ncbi:MAG: hypothetical protein QMD23_02610 [Candidatus Bathyarchaeia archaeon]|nr:hypothetical protein [Candidatus Bathyarchaeia archaeon]